MGVNTVHAVRVRWMQTNTTADDCELLNAQYHHVGGRALLFMLCNANQLEPRKTGQFLWCRFGFMSSDEGLPATCSIGSELMADSRGTALGCIDMITVQYHFTLCIVLIYQTTTQLSTVFAVFSSCQY
jgi:hypothetical protein